MGRAAGNAFDSSSAAAAALETVNTMTEFRRERVIRRVEDSALSMIDVHAARSITGIDQRFDRRRAELSAEYERRVDEDAPAASARPINSAADVVGMLLSVTAAALVLVGPSIALLVGASNAVALTVVAVALHIAAALSSRRENRAPAAGWSLIFATVAAAAVAAGWTIFRLVSVDGDRLGENGRLTVAVLAAVVALLGVICLAFSFDVARRAGIRRREISSSDTRLRESTSDLRSALEDARTAAKIEASRVLHALSDERRREFDAAVAVAVALLLKKQDAESNYLDPLKTAPHFDLRYDGTL